jgi:hypothetical protein
VAKTTGWHITLFMSIETVPIGNSKTITKYIINPSQYLIMILLSNFIFGISVVYLDTTTFIISVSFYYLSIFFFSLHFNSSIEMSQPHGECINFYKHINHENMHKDEFISEYKNLTKDIDDEKKDRYVNILKDYENSKSFKERCEQIEKDNGEVCEKIYMCDIESVYTKWKETGDGDIFIVCDLENPKLNRRRFLKCLKLIIDEKLEQPPILFLNDDGTLNFSDGRHRFLNFKMMGITRMPFICCYPNMYDYTIFE